MTDNNWNGSTKNEHHLILEKYTPESLVALRTELVKPENSDIFKRAIKEPTFEGALATIGECLDIALDGMYDVADLCDVLVSAMRKRSLYGNQPHLRDSRLCNVEMIERDGTVELEEIGNDATPTIAASNLGDVGQRREEDAGDSEGCCGASQGSEHKNGGENI